MLIQQNERDEALRVLEGFEGVSQGIQQLIEELTAVTDLTLNHTKILLEIVSSVPLVAAVMPETAADKTVTWSVSNPAVAEVSSEGVVTAINGGTAIITAAAGAGAITAACEVNAYSPTASGNSADNIRNGGYAAYYDGWVYLLKHGRNNIFRMRPDGSNIEKLNDEDSRYLNIVDGWIYYQGEDAMVYRMRTDGTERMKLNRQNSWYIHVVGGWIYYEVQEGPSEIFNLRLDGSIRESLGITNAIAAGDWIYYHQDQHIYRMRSDRSSTEVLTAVEGYYEVMSVADGWIYYLDTNSRGEGNLCRMRTDGTDSAIISEALGYFVVAGDWLYYVQHDEDPGIYRLRTDGSSREKLSDDDGVWINVVDDWVYYLVGDHYLYLEIYRMRLDGSDREKIVFP